MWNIENTTKLYELVEKQKLNFAQAAVQLGVSRASARRKFQRIDWNQFFKIKKDPALALDVLNNQNKGEWTNEEKVLLHTLRTETNPVMSFLDISKRVGRSAAACERFFQSMDWEKFFENIRISNNSEPEIPDPDLETDSKKDQIQSLVRWLVAMSRNNVNRLDEISCHEMLIKLNIKESQLPCSFNNLKDLAKKELGALGLDYPENLDLGKGTYIIIGDSHGKRTKRGVFSMLKVLSKHVKADKIIHIGHALDDDEDLSYCWEDIDNLIILAKREELQRLMSLNFPYEMARSKIFLGNLTLSNQDYISDYSPSFVGSLKRNHFEDSTIVNMHRQELATRTTGGSEEDRVQLASPGCLCEPHIIKTIRAVAFLEGKTMKISYPDSHIKYRRMDDFSKKNWEQGLIIVKVDEDGRYDFIQCRIFQTSKGYTTSYFDKIISESGVFNPDNKVFFNADAHCLNHDVSVFDIQEQFCKDYKPNVVVNMGDLIDNRSCNHHMMERNGFQIPGSDILDESASAHYVLKKMSTWGKELHLILGNHERFAKDIAEKFPQFKRLFDMKFMIGVDRIKAKVTDYRGVLKIGDIKFNHGDMKLFGAKGGTKIEKVFNTFGRDSILGHLHSPTIRNNCYLVGLSGNLDQEYNEIEASSWMHGFGHINVFENKAFTALINIRDYKTWINGKYYIPKNTKSWDLPKYKVDLAFDFGV